MGTVRPPYLWTTSPQAMDREQRKRQANRDQYARKYPIGCKRVRTPEQREKQRIAQRLWKRRVIAGPRRQMTDRVKRLASGVPMRDVAEETVGCSREAFMKHLRSTMVNPDAAKFTLRYHIPVRNFDMSDPQQVKAAFHYTNIYAKEIGALAFKWTGSISLVQARRLAATI